MENRRIEFYPDSSYMLDKAIEKIREIELPRYDALTINDAIEFCEIHKYLESDKQSKFNSVDIEKCHSLFGLATRFINSVDGKSVHKYYTDLEITYRDNFWEQFDRCKLYDRIPDAALREILDDEHFRPYNLFKYKSIVKKYDNILRNAIMSDFMYIDIVLGVYQQNFSDREKVFLPDSFSTEDINEYLCKHIESFEASPGALELIINMKNTGKFAVTDEIKLKAKRKLKAQIAERINKEGTFSLTTHFTISDSQQEPKLAKMEGREIFFSYSKKFLQATMDYQSILYNFIRLFEFADSSQMRCNFVSKKSRVGIFEQLFQPNLSCYYPKNESFSMMNTFAKIFMSQYYEFLKENGVSYENVLKWFFTEYLHKEFGCPSIRVVLPSENTTFAEKCSTICSAMDAVLKQFSSYVKYGEIDYELVAMSSGSQKYDQVLSLNQGKYIYGTGSIF